MINKKQKLKSLLIYIIIVVVGLILFKYLPMSIYGKEILFDASQHLVITLSILYIIWNFIEKNKDWRIPYFFILTSVITIVSIQRIESNAHSDIGLLIGLLVVLISIVISRWEDFRGKFSL